MIKNVLRSGKAEERYLGPFRVIIHTTKDSYVLSDDANNFISRGIPTSQIKLVFSDNAIKPDSASVANTSNAFFEVQGIFSRQGISPTNYLYRVRWKGNTKDDDTWEPACHFFLRRNIIYLTLPQNRRVFSNVQYTQLVYLTKPFFFRFLAAKKKVRVSNVKS